MIYHNINTSFKTSHENYDIINIDAINIKQDDGFNDIFQISQEDKYGYQKQNDTQYQPRYIRPILPVQNARTRMPC